MPPLMPQPSTRSTQKPLIDAAAVTTLTGTAVDLNTAFDSAASGLGDEAVTLTDTTLNAAVLNALDDNTTGIIDASTVTTLTGSATDLIEAVTSNGISNLGNVDITVDSGTATTAQANELADETSGIVTATIAEGDLATLAALTEPAMPTPSPSTMPPLMPQPSTHSTQKPLLPLTPLPSPHLRYSRFSTPPSTRQASAISAIRTSLSLTPPSPLQSSSP